MRDDLSRASRSASAPRSGSLPGYSTSPASHRVRNIYDFDDRFTAQAFGFGTADNYYATQSSNQFLDRIRVPTLLVQAKDDPLIPFRSTITRHSRRIPTCGCWRSSTAATSASSQKPSRVSGWIRFS